MAVGGRARERDSVSSRRVGASSQQNPEADHSADGSSPNRGYEAFHRPRFDFLLGVLESHLPKSNARVLDIGRSPLTSLLAEKLAVRVDCLGLEPDGSLPEGGRQYCFDLNDTQHRERWRLALGPYDVVVFAEVIEHLHTAPELVLAYLHELLVPGGLLLVQTPNAVSLRKRVKLAMGLNPFERIRVDISNPGHFREYTAGELREILVSAGFQVRQMWSNRGRSRRNSPLSRSACSGRQARRPRESLLPGATCRPPIR
jgi:SAM-dependent methyltransferase